MKKVMKNVKSKLKLGVSEVKSGIMSAAVVWGLHPTKVLAGPKINPNLGMEDGMGAILTIIFQIAFYVGALGVVMGIFMTVQSFMSDNPENRNRGVTVAIVGAVLMGLQTLLKAAGILT